MNITLDAHPPNAPCCVRVVSEDGRDKLFQTDYDWPAIASIFGWSTNHNFKDNPDSEACLGSKLTDGTVDCPQCGKKAGQFIAEAREYLDDHDGEQAEDPGYFGS